MSNSKQSNWRIIDMDELYDYFHKDETCSIKPKFPTRRWGHVYTKISTTNIVEVNKSLKLLKEDGFDVRKRLEKKNNIGKFYMIEINSETKLINNNGK